MDKKSHPSLSASFIAPDFLEPKEYMAAYDPCWCNSGKKWKWCHKDRDKQSLPKEGKFSSDIRSTLRNGYCSHPDASETACSGKIIRSHTIQKKVGLEAIKENGHVYSIRSGFENVFKNNGIIVPDLIGVQDASTFLGFCNYHDTTMFKPVETGKLYLDNQTAFLLSFRAICYDLFTKKCALNIIPIQREADKGKPFKEQAFIQNHLHLYERGLKRGLADISMWKEKYDEAYREANFSKLKFYAISFSEILPVVAAGVFHPEFSIKGKPLQRLSRGSAPFEHIAFNLTVLNGSSVLVLGSIENSPGPAEEFIESFLHLSSEQKADAAMRTSFLQIENTFMNPSWWDGLENRIKEKLIEMSKSGTGDIKDERNVYSFRPLEKFLSEARVTQGINNL